jgi:hypothetical protein
MIVGVQYRGEACIRPSDYGLLIDLIILCDNCAGDILGKRRNGKKKYYE